MIILSPRLSTRECTRPAPLAITHNAGGNQPDVQQQGREPALPLERGGRQGLSGRFLGLSSCPIPPALKFLDPRRLAPAGFGACWWTVPPCAISPAFLVSDFLTSSQAHEGCSSGQNAVPSVLSLEILTPSLEFLLKMSVPEPSSLGLL